MWPGLRSSLPGFDAIGAGLRPVVPVRFSSVNRFPFRLKILSPGRTTAMVALALLFAVSPFAKAPARAADPVDLLLVFAADVSRSVDHVKFQLQRNGYAAAIADPRVIEAVTAGPKRRIAVAFVEWSGPTAQRTVIDWTLIDGADAARRFGERLRELPRAFAERTSISGAIEFSMGVLERAPYTAPRRVIDVSGDGTNNSGGSVTLVRDKAAAAGITVNGLVILSAQPMPWNPDHTHPPGGLAEYYRANVIGGRGAFVEVAETFESFGQAIIRKMIAEIASPQPLRHPRAAAREACPACFGIVQRLQVAR